jgi:small subunit ribosomal protein S5
MALRITPVGDNQEGMQEKLVTIRRVTKVVKGGRLFGFSVLSVVGDGKGRVGFGHGKAREVQMAIQKSQEAARRNMAKVWLKGSTLQYAVKSKYGASKIFMKPAAPGTGVIAGGAMRAVLELAGVKDVLAKCYGSTNASNVVHATLKGLMSVKSPRQVAAKRGKTLEDLST